MPYTINGPLTDQESALLIYLGHLVGLTVLVKPSVLTIVWLSDK